MKKRKRIIEGYLKYELDTVNEFENMAIFENEIHKLFGIEGTRYAIIRELSQTVSDGAGSNINERHYAVLADLMTYRGKIMQIQKDGFGKSPYIGPLGRATYEVMNKILVTSGIFAEEDNMEGTSSNLITGQGPKSGTNSFEIFMNKNLLPLPNQKQEFYPPEQNINEKPEVDYSPAFSPIESPENFQFDDDFMEKMNASKEVRIEDYLKAIGAQSTAVDDNDFNFGYGISGVEENMLPETKVTTIEVNIIESENNVKNRRRRKR